MGINFVSTQFVIENDEVFRRKNFKKSKFLGKIKYDEEDKPYLYHEKAKTYIGVDLTGLGAELNSRLWDIYGPN